jgi:ATP-dependent DNA ligase
MIGLIAPMLATLVPKPFHREGWVYEEKYDGVRALAYRRGDGSRLYSRNLKEITGEFPEITEAVTGLSDGPFVLDGEIVAFDHQGVSRFQLLQRRALGEPIHPVFAVFDCLERDAAGLLERPLAERRRAVEAMMPARRGVLMLSQHRSRSYGVVGFPV